MASVVIIHAAENALPARALADKLRAMRLNPVIELPPGDALRQAIQESVAAVALWSPSSAEQQSLLDEAARAGGKLINARMQNAAAPAQFRDAPTIDLTGWRGEDTFAGWRALAAEVAKKAGVSAPAAAPPPPAPAPAPAAGGGSFFNPGAAAPQPAPPPRTAPVAVAPQPSYTPAPPRAAPPVYTPPADSTSYDEPPPKRGPNLAVIGIVTFLVVAAIGVGGYFFYERMQNSSAATAAWEELDKTDPASLRAFLEGPNVGDYQEEAEAALEGLEVERLNEARARDTIESLEAFLRDFPGSRHSLEINGRIAELRSTAAPLPAIDPVTGLPIDPNAPATAGATGVEPLPPAAPAPTPAPSGAGPVPLTPPEETLPDGALNTQTQ